MKILYQDKELIVCIKPAGVVSTDEPGGMPERIRQEIGAEQGVRAVHRLDSVVGGLMVYALSSQAAAGLTAQIEDGSFVKEYFAVIEGKMEEAKGELHDLLRRDQKARKTYVVQKPGRDAKEAALQYQVLGVSGDCSLVQVHLLTGRTHQIRAQFSSRKLPLYGDRKYGAVHTDAGIALWSCHLHFVHPVTGEELDFQAFPPAKIPWTAFSGYTAEYEEQDIAVEFKRSRTFSDCPCAHVCDGCAYQGMEYAKQLEKKQKAVEKAFRAYGTPSPIIGTEETAHCRYKAVVDFGTDKSGRVISGIYSRTSRKLIPIGNCSMYHPKIKEVTESLCGLVNKYQLAVFDVKKKAGWLRRAVIRVSAATGEILLTLSAVSEDFPSKKAFVKELRELHPEIAAMVFNVNPAASQAQLGKEDSTLWGTGYIEEEIAGIRCRIFARSAYPVTPLQTEVLYRKAIEQAALNEEARVLLVNCGAGILGMLAARQAKKVLAVDANREAVAEAGMSAKENGMENLRLICADTGDYTEALVRSHDRIDVVLLDAACGRLKRECMEAAAKLQPERIVCVSGSPELLSADIGTLVQFGYACKEILPVDVQPFSGQTGVAVLLTKSVLNSRL